MLGLYVLGFTSVFREGFETVLFLQALQLESGTGIVLAGVDARPGRRGRRRRRSPSSSSSKLPYKKMLIVTGVLISLVLVVMVGNTMRTLQGVGWLSITPIDIEFPLWMGTWLGVFPTVETLGAQVLAFAFVIGSYFAAEWVRKRNVRRAAAANPLPAAARPLARRLQRQRQRQRLSPACRRAGRHALARVSRETCSQGACSRHREPGNRT